MPTSSQRRNTIVLIYIGLSLAALVPGLALKVGIDGTGIAGLEILQRALADIRFGSGLRFWLGVTGASMMALLILYPLRKAFAKARGVGSVGAWFHVHILFGLIGPVLILYHSNFSHGGSNANVALWSMLVVAGSGIIGYFVYARVSRSFYSATEQARRHRDVIITAMPDLDPANAWKENLVGKFEGFEAELLTPRQGVIASLRARLRVEQWKRGILHDISWIVAETSHRQGLSIDADRRLRALIGGHARTYFAIARSAASQSVREQLWARWRLLHLPVFLVMIAAIILHVVAVWNMDTLSPQREQHATARDGHPAPPAPVDPVEALLRADASPIVAPVPRKSVTQPLKPATARAATEKAIAAPAVQPVPNAAPDNESAVLAARAAGLPVRSVKTQDLKTNARPADLPVPPSADTTPSPVEPPKLVLAPLPAPMAVAVPAAAPAPGPIKAAALPPRAAPVAAPPVAVPSPIAVQPDMKPIDSELQRRNEAPLMALGGVKPRTLDEQIATLKARQQAGQFAHALAETGFALTGKHLKVECASCHSKPLAEAPSSNPRQCVACHKKDDIHKGRQPDCASCHTPNRWSQILKPR